jgi:hypothetical protein
MGQDREAGPHEDLAEIASEPNVNQVRDEPIPASHHEERGEQAGPGTEKPAGDHEAARPASRDTSDGAHGGSHNGTADRGERGPADPGGPGDRG